MIAFFSPKQALNASSSSHVQEAVPFRGLLWGQERTTLWSWAYNLQNGALAACTATTLRLFAGRKGYPLTRIQVSLSYRHGATGDLDSFDRTMHLEGDLPRSKQRGSFRQPVCVRWGRPQGVALTFRPS